MKRVPFKVVDVFTPVSFAGNPAGVVWEDRDLSAEEMQNIAKEVNLSETAFLVKPEGDANVGVRFFTPEQELELAGHPTIALFHVLAEEGKFFLREPVTVVTQETKAGVLPVELHVSQGKVKKIIMSQLKPSYAPFEESWQDLAETLGADPHQIVATDLPVEIVSTGLSHLIVPIKNLEDLESLRPDSERLAALNRNWGVDTTHVFTQQTKSPLSMVHTRDFGPAVGIREDPATGTANGALGAYLIKNKIIRGNSPLTIISEQGYTMGRPSEITIEIHFEDSLVNLVKVGGKAVTVLEGEIIV